MLCSYWVPVVRFCQRDFSPMAAAANITVLLECGITAYHSAKDLF